MSSPRGPKNNNEAIYGSAPDPDPGMRDSKEYAKIKVDGVAPIPLGTNNSPDAGAPIEPRRGNPTYGAGSAAHPPSRPSDKNARPGQGVAGNPAAEKSRHLRQEMKKLKEESMTIATPRESPRESPVAMARPGSPTQQDSSSTTNTNSSMTFRHKT